MSSQDASQPSPPTGADVDGSAQHAQSAKASWIQKLLGRWKNLGGAGDSQQSSMQPAPSLKVRFGPWWDHLGLVASVALSLIVMVRVTVVSGYSVTTATAIIHEVGPGNVVLGTLLASSGLVAAIGYSAIGMFLISTPQQRAWVDAGVTTALSPMLIFCASLLPWPTVLMLTVLLVIAAVVRRKGGRLDHVALLIFGVAIVVGVVFSKSSMWVPPSSIDPVKGDPYLGYILKEEDKKLLILKDDPRKLELVPESDVTSHKWCDNQGRSLASVVGLLKPPSYGDCPDTRE
ncbi:hypothetical protein [Nocardioides sp. NPDC004968]|uniref:hypothetical protein n=1 Tax=Nocardioides sp. NPDC004968 TaxID=3155894 RepID=UPI0033BD8B97